MKKIIGYLSILLFTLLSLVSCSKPSVYKMYKDNNIDLGKDTVYTLTTPEELVKVCENTNEIIYVFYGSAKNFNCQAAITDVQVQANQFKVSVVYYIDADEFGDTEAKRKELKNQIGINDASTSFIPTLLAYNKESFKDSKLKPIFDTSHPDFARHFKKDGKLDYVRVASFMFRDKCNPEQLPKI